VSAGIDTTSVLEELIPAVPGAIQQKVRAIGFARVSAALVDELVHRCEPPARSGGVEIHLRITSGAESADHTVAFGDETIAARPGVPDSPWARLEFTVDNLAKALFGRPGPVNTAAWRHEALQLIGPETPPEEIQALLKVQEGAMRANDALLAACSPHRASLNQLASRFVTDKWGLVHWYTPYYERHFAPFADEEVRVLEIGIGGYHDLESGGASLRMWQQFFRRGIVYGLDVYEKRLDTPRIRTIQGDQSDKEFLRRMSEEHGPFDIIVDDGSHFNRDVLASFDALFPLLKEGGIYAIEDLQTAYWPSWGGDDEDTAAPTTSIGFLKKLIDGLYHREYEAGKPSYLDENVLGLYFYHNLAFVLKGANNECGAPAVVREMPPDYIPGGE
jgi:MycE methyltransferase N-terminal